MDEEFLKFGDAFLKRVLHNTRSSSKIDLTDILPPAKIGDLPYVRHCLTLLRALGFIDSSDRLWITLIYGYEKNQTSNQHVTLTDKGIDACKSSLSAMINDANDRKQRDQQLFDLSVRSTLAAERSAEDATRANRIAWIAIWCAAGAAIITAMAWLFPRVAL